MTGTDTTRPAPSREPELLRARGFADLLAAVPSIIGMHPEESLVVVPFLGARTGGGFRIPLPARLRRAEIEELARGCVRVMESMPRARSVLAIVYTSRSFDDSLGIPLLDLGRAVLDRLERTDLGIVDVACVAADGWGRYTSLEECREPRSLDEIEGSETGLLARAAAPEPLDVSAAAELPVVSDGDRAVVEEVLRRRAAGVRDAITLVERWLAGPPVPRRDATLIRLLQSPALRDQTTLQIALGSRSALEERQRQRRLEGLQAFSGLSMDEIVERELREGDVDPHDLAAAALLMGTGPGPDRERVRLATVALGRSAALAPVEARPPVLTVLAWCWWSLGVASVAAHFLGEALRIDPRYSMANLYRTAFEARAVPDWVLEAASQSLDRAAVRA